MVDWYSTSVDRTIHRRLATLLPEKSCRVLDLVVAHPVVQPLPAAVVADPMIIVVPIAASVVHSDASSVPSTIPVVAMPVIGR